MESSSRTASCIDCPTMTAISSTPFCYAWETYVQYRTDVVVPHATGPWDVFQIHRRVAVYPVVTEGGKLALDRPLSGPCDFGSRSYFLIPVLVGPQQPFEPKTSSLKTWWTVKSLCMSLIGLCCDQVWIMLMSVRLWDPRIARRPRVKS